MKLTVFGGTGPTGRELLRLAVADGHRVTAIARDPAALAGESAALGGSGLTVRAGDVLDPDSLAGACDGADAVLSALGARNPGGETTVYSVGAGHILDAMRAAGVGRLVVLTAAPVAPREQHSLLERLVVHPVLYRFFGGGYRDMARMEQLLRARTDVEWTVLRPPRLLDKPGSGRYRTAIESRLPGGWSISRADLARAMLDTLGNPATSRAAVTVAN